MTKESFESYLAEVLEWAADEDGMIESIETYDEAGILSQDRGLVVKMTDGRSEFQLTIVKSS